MMNPGELTITPYREMGAGIKLVRGYFVHIWIRQIAIYIYSVHMYLRVLRTGGVNMGKLTLTLALIV